MGRLREYLKCGLILSEGLAFSLEDCSEVDCDFVRRNLDYAFKRGSPSRWICRPTFPTRENGFQSGITYVLKRDAKREVRVSKTQFLNDKTTFRTEVCEGERTQVVDSNLEKSRAVLERLFEHIHKYAVHAY